MKNPFALRDGKIIVISDLTLAERGLKCGAVCPECKGEFKAKMGEVKAHHFAHTKDACDETAAFIKSLLLFVKQMIEDEAAFYAPALKLVYRMTNYEFDREDIGEYVRIVTDDQDLDFGKHKMVVCDESKFRVDINGVEMILDGKGRAEALIVKVKNRENRLAVRVWPPRLCKSEIPRPFGDLPTLVCDAREIDFYDAPSEQIIAHLKEHKIWHWIQNPKVKIGYDRIYRRNQNFWKDLLKKEAEEKAKKEELRQQQAREMERQQKQPSQRESNENKNMAQPLSVPTVSTPEQNKKIVNLPRPLSPAEKQKLGYEQVKNMDFDKQPETFDASDLIFDSFGKRWVKCVICGGIKLSAEFWTYGGGEKGSWNRGQCNQCRNLKYTGVAGYDL